MLFVHTLESKKKQLSVVPAGKVKANAIQRQHGKGFQILPIEIQTYRSRNTI